MYNAFFSYATKDGMSLAKSVANMLQKDYCLDVFLAEEKIRVGEFIESKIKSALIQSQRLLVFFTLGASESDWVLGEIDLARKLHKDIIVFKSQNLDDSCLPIPIRCRKYTTFINKADLLNKVQQIKWGIPVIIPAGGIAGGLHPISVGMPKLLFPVGTKPILHHIVHNLDPRVFSKVIIVTSRFSKMVKYYADILKSDIPVECRHIPGKSPIVLKELRLKSKFLVHYCDIILEDKVNWKQFIKFHKLMREEKKVIGTLMVSDQYDLRIGRVVTDDHLIQKFVEKPKQTLGYSVNVAVSIFEPEFLTYIRKKDVRLFGDSVQNAMKAGKTFAAFPHKPWKHIQTMSDWYEAQKEHFPEDLS